MSVVEENIKRVNVKLQQLLKQYQHLQRENEQLLSALTELKSNREKDLQRIAWLEQQANILKTAAGKMNETDKRLFQNHISRYIKEIDKCIGLLSE